MPRRSSHFRITGNFNRICRVLDVRELKSYGCCITVIRGATAENANLLRAIAHLSVLRATVQSAHVFLFSFETGTRSCSSCVAICRSSRIIIAPRCSWRGLMMSRTRAIGTTTLEIRAIIGRAADCSQWNARTV